jgi:hypothetical protein
MAFPTSGVLDNFNRANENPLSDGGKWSIGPDDFGGTNNLRVASNECFMNATPANGYRNDQDYGPDAEAHMTLVVIPVTAAVLYLRLVNIGAGTTDGYAIYFDYNASPDSWVPCRVDNDALSVLGATVSPGNSSVGDGLGIEMIGTTLAGYDRRAGVWTQRFTRTDANYAAAGKIGLRLSDAGANARVDDFGGGTIATASLSPRRRDRQLTALGQML